jgi:hypothetical protein
VKQGFSETCASQRVLFITAMDMLNHSIDGGSLGNLLLTPPPIDPFAMRLGRVAPVPSQTWS